MGYTKGYAGYAGDTNPKLCATASFFLTVIT